MRLKTTLATCVLVAAVMPSFAQITPTRPTVAPAAPIRAKGEAATVAEIQEQLASPDPTQHKLAIDAIRARMQTRGLADLKSYWSKSLLTAKEYQPAADLALEGILLTPGETRAVEAALQLRIKALLALGQGEAALSNAKSLFNVSSMSGTSEAILLLAECISTARPKDIELFNRFREEQIAGAATPIVPTTRPAATQGKRSTVMDSIKVNPKPYDDALAKLTGEDADSLRARGNLLLLADRA
jgi:hypothetical protein